MTRRHHLIALLGTLLFSGCATEIDLPSDTSQAPIWDGGEPADQDEASLAEAILAFANDATPPQLDDVLNRQAARSIRDTRPFATLAALGDASYVGDAALNAMLAHVAPNAVDAGAGFWLEVLVDAQQAQAIVEMAMVLELNAFNCDLGFGTAMAQRIVGHRPYASIDDLLAVSYVGKSALSRLKANADWWLTGAASETERFDCVAFTPEQASAALVVANHAGYSQLCSASHCGFGAWTRQVGIILAGRDWSSLTEVETTSFVGPSAMHHLRTLADRYLAGNLEPAADSIRGLIAREIPSEHLYLPRVRALGVETIVPFNKPGTGYYFHSCARVADYDDPTPEADGHWVLYCDGDWGWDGLPAWFKSWIDGYVESGDALDLRDVRWFDEAAHGPVLFHTPKWYI